MSRTLLLVVLLALAPAALAQTYSGTLERGDDTLDSGEYRDSYAVPVRRGDRVSAVLTSRDFDPYLVVIQPSGEQDDNDDCTTDDLQRSCLDLVADADGSVRVLVTSYAAGETGPYRLEITVGAGRRIVASGASRSGDRSGRGAPATPLRLGEPVDGALGADDGTIRTGEYADAFTVDLRAGQRLDLDLTSRDFDPYLLTTSPSGDQDDNDDCSEGDTSRSCLSLVADQSGSYRVVVTSYAPGETGRYRLTATASGVPRETTAGLRPVRGGSPSTRYESGTLASGDATLRTGELSDRFSFAGTGGPVTVDLRSRDFDPYLIVTLPSGEQLDNDDYEGALDRSLLVVDTEPSGTYAVIVTSYAAGETGAYDLTIDGVGTATTVASPVAQGVRQERGRLDRDDETLRSGEFVDTYTFDGVPGQRIAIDLTSDAFDTYLLVSPPRGATLEDDDGGGRVGHSRLEMDLTEPGSYTVFVTSYAAGETGAYALSMDFTQRFGATPEGGRPPVTRDVGGDAGPVPPTAPGSYRPPTRRVADWTLAETLRGELDATDARLASGEYHEVHTFEGEAGEPIRIEMASDRFDTYLIVTAPSGQQVDNDDADGDATRSVVEFVMPETGRYRITATSYRAGETGPYTIRMTQADALVPDPAPFDRIVGVFVGISDYDRPGLPDLRYTAQDAVTTRDAMIAAGMDPSDGILLTDAEATVANVERAFRELARRTDARTQFVFFFSGHGAQYARPTAQREDPDGKDESIELFDAALLDDALDGLLGRLLAVRQLIVLDACFSGGFAKDIITQPGRMGLFSSEEDIVSAVAVKFEAGGYLSRFFADGIAGRQADADANGAVTPLELSQYLLDRYTSDVRGTGREMIVSRATRPEHQHLVVDRGSLGLYDTLFLVP